MSDSDGAGPPAPWHPDTLAVRAGLARTPFDETSEALFLNSGYVYPDAEEAAAAFAGTIERFRYSRVGSPTVKMLEERVRALEGAEAAQATASGMAAVFMSLLASLRAGDRVVAARSMFGSCFVIVDQILPRFGVQTEFVDGDDLDQWAAALASPAQAVLFETPSNPMQQLIDIKAVADLAHEAGARVIVDNAFVSPVCQRPFEFGADVVVYSTTKHMDGQGRTLGGVILGPKQWITDEVKPLMRHTGPSMSPFTAWVVLKGLETLRLRVEHQAASALRIAEWLEGQGGIRWVRYPMLDSHPQAELARKQMSAGGTVVTFEVDGDRARAFAVLNALGLIDISNNFADSKSLAAHPATTTHHSMGAEARAAIGLSDGVIRVSVGLEHPDDLIADLANALKA